MPAELQRVEEDNMHRRQEAKRLRKRSIAQELKGILPHYEDPTELSNKLHNCGLKRFLGVVARRSKRWRPERAPSLIHLPAGEPAVCVGLRSGALNELKADVAIFADGSRDCVTAQCLTRAPHFNDGIPCEHLTKVALQYRDLTGSITGMDIFGRIDVEPSCRLRVGSLLHSCWLRDSQEWARNFDASACDWAERRFARLGRTFGGPSQSVREGRMRILRRSACLGSKALFDKAFRLPETRGASGLAAFHEEMKQLRSLVGEPDSADSEPARIDAVRNPTLRGRVRKRAKASGEKKKTRKERRAKKIAHTSTSASLLTNPHLPAPPLARGLELDFGQR